MPSLALKLTAALKSREERSIRRRLPPPSSLSKGGDLVDFSSNDYLSLATSPALRAHFLTKLKAAPDVLGSGGSRLLVNGDAHSALESRLARFFNAPAAVLFNSGFDANAGLFACLPQPGDVVVHDEYIHASVHDGIRASRIRGARYAFAHNSMHSLREVLLRVRAEREEGCCVFVAVESVYSMEGSVAPLKEIVQIVEDIFPCGRGYVIVDEAHATGVYGPQGRGMVAMLGLENRVLARLHTFGKALASTGAVVLTSELIRDYLLNFARPLIFTTSLSYANIVLAECSFDLLENGTAQILAERLFELSNHFISLLRAGLGDISSDLLSLPHHIVSDSPFPPAIIPIMTCHPRSLYAYLYARGMNARPIRWPTVPKGKDRVRVCLHAQNSGNDVERLVDGILSWAAEKTRERRRSPEYKL